jgi:hypothetical protein
MASEPQDNLAEAGDVEKNMPSATSSTEDLVSESNNLAAERGTITNMPSKGKKRRRGYSGGVRSEFLILITLWR